MVAINSATLSEPMFVHIKASPMGLVPPPHEPMRILCGEDAVTTLSRENEDLKLRLAVAERTCLERSVASAQAENAYLRASCQALGVPLAQTWAEKTDFSCAEEIPKPPGLELVKSAGLETLSDASTADSSRAPSDVGSSAGDAVSTTDADEIEANTLIMQNIPNRYSRNMLLALFDECGFQNLYNLVYLPTDFMTSVNFGFAFVHFISSDVAQRFRTRFHGFSEWNCNSSKICAVDFCAEQCGLDALIKRYQNCPVMHELVPDEYKPALFLDGVRTAFPAPTKKLKKPRMKATRALS